MTCCWIEAKIGLLFVVITELQGAFRYIYSYVYIFCFISCCLYINAVNAPR